jgi:AcrR family transcriptional regulator
LKAFPRHFACVPEGRIGASRTGIWAETHIIGLAGPPSFIMPSAKKPAAKKKAVDVVPAALQLIAQKGYSKITLAEIAKSAGADLASVKERYEDKDEVLHEAFKRGQRGMERKLRQQVTGDLGDHLGTLFDGFMEAVAPWGPELYMGMLYQATEDRALYEAVRKASEGMNFAVKAYLAQMVAMAIVEEIQGVERVNREMVSTFMEYLAGVLEGKKLADIRKAWVSNAGHMMRPSSKTTVP